MNDKYTGKESVSGQNEPEPTNQELLLRLRELEEKQRETEARLAITESRLATTEQHISEIYNAQNIEETFEVLRSFAQNTLEAESVTVYGVDSRTDKLYAVKNGEIERRDIPEIVSDVKACLRPTFENGSLYIPMLDKNNNTMAVVQADSPRENVTYKTAEEFQSGGVGAAFGLALSTERVAQEGRTDQLTKIENRHGMQHHAEKRMVKDINNSDEPVHIVMLDIDKFKNFNDTYGHAAGDVVLAHTAQLLENNLRESDRVFRFGGEEMAMILNGASAEDAVKLANNLRELLAETPVDIGNGQLVTVTASMGVARVPFEGADVNRDNIQKVLDASMAEADINLYAAKAAGRNCVMDTAMATTT